MKSLLKAVVSGFGFSLGAAIYSKVSKRIGEQVEHKKEAPTPSPDIAEDGEVGEDDTQPAS